MIKDKVRDFNFVPPMDTIVEIIEQLESTVENYREYISEMDKTIARLRGRVDKMQKDFDLIKGYLP